MEATELDLVVKSLEVLEREQAAAGLFRWSGMTAMARNTILVLALRLQPQSPPLPPGPPE